MDALLVAGGTGIIVTCLLDLKWWCHFWFPFLY